MFRAVGKRLPTELADQIYERTLEAEGIPIQTSVCHDVLGMTCHPQCANRVLRGYDCGRIGVPEDYWRPFNVKEAKASQDNDDAYYSDDDSWGLFD